MVTDFESEKEKSLVERLKQRERSALDEIVRIYRNKGFGVAYNIVGNPEDAKDVLQEAFIKVYLNINGFKGKSKFSTWFYRVVVNCALDFLRKKKSMHRIFCQPLTDEEGNEKEVPDTRYDPAKMLLAQELGANLDNCIAGLPEKQKICFILKHRNGLSNMEIAQILKCNLSTVKVHLFRAVRNLQGKLRFYLADK